MKQFVESSANQVDPKHCVVLTGNSSSLSQRLTRSMIEIQRTYKATCGVWIRYLFCFEYLQELTGMGTHFSTHVTSVRFDAWRTKKLRIEKVTLKLPEKDKPRTWVIPILLGLVCLGLITWANYHILNTPEYAHRDFMSLWGGGRAILLDIDPYDREIWVPLRYELGSIWGTGDAVNPFPLWTLLVMTPLSSLPIGWGAAIWITLSLLLLAVAILLLSTVLGTRRPTVAEFALLALGAFTFRASLVTLGNGQITLVLLAILTLFLVLMKRNHPYAAGFILSFIILKPNPFILFAPLVAFWLLIHKRWRVIAGGLTSVALMLIVSWAVIPGWLINWLTVREKTGTTIRTFIMPTLWGAAAEINRQWAPLLGFVFVVALTAGLGWYLFTRKDLDISNVVALAIVGSILIAPYAWAYEHALLLIPLVLLFMRLERRWLAWLVWITLIFILPWILYRYSNEQDRGTFEVLVPLLTLIAFWLFVGVARTRRQGERRCNS